MLHAVVKVVKQWREYIVFGGQSQTGNANDVVIGLARLAAISRQRVNDVLSGLTAVGAASPVVAVNCWQVFSTYRSNCCSGSSVDRWSPGTVASWLEFYKKSSFKWV